MTDSELDRPAVIDEPDSRRTPIADAVAADVGFPAPLPDWVMDPFAPVPSEPPKQSGPQKRTRTRKQVRR